MSQQTPNLRTFLQVVWRHKTLVGIMTALGLLIGAAFAVLNPPAITSNALVMLPQSAPSIQTQVVIASSDPVLSAAAPSITPTMSVDDLRSKVSVKSLTSYVLSVSATSTTAAQAEAIANAVANSYINYVGSGRLIQNVPARVLESATTATGTKPLESLIIYGFSGALLGVVIGAIAAIRIDRKDPRLRERDDIANSLGVPVIASIPVDHPTNAEDWAKLLQDYRPAVVHEWHLRKLLKQLGVLSANLNNGSDGDARSIAVLSLSSDARALALGPQLAVFAASLGISTELVIGPQQDTNSVAFLRTACAAASPASSKSPNRLRVTVTDDSNVAGKPGVALVVVVVVVDSSNPRVPDTVRTRINLLGVSAGVASAEQLARAAVSAAADGRNITGILIADPEPTDRTTGSVPQLVRPAAYRLPTRLNGMTEIKR